MTAWRVALWVCFLQQLLVQTQGFVVLARRSSRSRTATTAALLRDEERLTDVFKAAQPSVVYISTLTSRFNPILFNVLEVPSQTGSGFVWSDRYVVTNAHVVEAGRGVGAKPLTASTDDSNSSTSRNNNNVFLVTFLTGPRTTTSFRARLRGIDSAKDVAVLEVFADAKGKPLTPAPAPESSFSFKPIERGCSASLAVGQTAIAIGNPFGLDLTMTTGVVSGLGRTIALGSTYAFDMLQTSAAINHGTSGGPLLDSSGKLIGMNTAIYSTSGSSSGVGFAIPVDNLSVWVSLLLRDGKIDSPKTGLSVVGGYAARAIGVADRGVLVRSVERGSPAAAAGLRAAVDSFGAADVILQVNDEDVDTEADLERVLCSAQTAKAAGGGASGAAGAGGGGGGGGGTALASKATVKLLVSRALGAANGDESQDKKRRNVVLNMPL